MKSWLEKNHIEIYPTHNERKSHVAERLIRTLKGRVWKHMTSISKIVYFNKLDDIVNQYNKTYHGTIKMKLADVKDDKYIDSSKEVNDKDPKFQVGDHVRISK